MERENDTEMDGERIVIEWSRDSRGEGRSRGVSLAIVSIITNIIDMY